PEEASHSRVVPSSLPVRTERPSGEYATALVCQGYSCRRTASCLPEVASHSQAVIKLPVRTVRPSGEYATALTRNSCCRTASCLPEEASHSRAVLSWLPVRMVRPS